MKKITLLLLTFCSFIVVGQVKLTSSVEEYFDGTNWLNSAKYVYEYDTNNNLTSENYYYWNSITSLWEFSSKETIAYNSANKITSESYEGYDSSTGNVTYGYKTNYVYNGNNELIESTSLELSNGVYVNENKSTYTYTNNKITELIDLSWNGSAWVLIAESDDQDSSSKITISYGVNGLVSEFMYYEWNGSSWSADDKDVYTYNANNKIANLVSYDWNGSAYDISYKEEYNYDANGNLILEEDFDYNDGSYESEYEMSYTFDETQIMSSFTHPFIDRHGFEALTGQDTKFINKLIGSVEDSNYRNTYYYGEATASVKDFGSIDFAVFPNPTKNILKIDDARFTLKNIEIFNVLGKKVFASNKNEINIAHLVNGVYLLKIESEKGSVATKRIIKN